jgi:putative hydrolase of the HAD superfamily
MPVLEWLASEGVEVAVLTNGADYQQRQKLAAVGLSDHVGPVFCSDTIGRSKPDRRAFLHVCERLGHEPGNVLSVGDRYDLDVLAARAVGIRAVHLDRNRTASGQDPHRINTLYELNHHL